MIFRKDGQKPQLVLDSNPRRVSLKEQLSKALDVEDYELAAELKDRIKAKKRDMTWRVPSI